MSGRIYLIDTREGGDGWTVADGLTGGCLSFKTRREAVDFARFVRAYLARWGSIDWDSVPYSMESAPDAGHRYQ
jgi:hypothetical protein